MHKPSAFLEAALVAVGAVRLDDMPHQQKRREDWQVGFTVLDEAVNCLTNLVPFRITGVSRHPFFCLRQAGDTSRRSSSVG